MNAGKERKRRRSVSQTEVPYTLKTFWVVPIGSIRRYSKLAPSTFSNQKKIFRILPRTFHFFWITICTSQIFLEDLGTLEIIRSSIVAKPFLALFRNVSTTLSEKFTKKGLEKTKKSLKRVSTIRQPSAGGKSKTSTANVPLCSSTVDSAFRSTWSMVVFSSYYRVSTKLWRIGWIIHELTGFSGRCCRTRVGPMGISIKTVNTRCTFPLSWKYWCSPFSTLEGHVDLLLRKPTYSSCIGSGSTVKGIFNRHSNGKVLFSFALRWKFQRTK